MKTFKVTWLTRLVLGFLLAAGWPVAAIAANLLTCTHTSGGIAYTRTPEILGAEFKCIDPTQKAAPTPARASQLDPTPSARREDPDCPSTTRLKVRSSSYSGSFNVELRKGSRPGSSRVSGGTVSDGGEVSFPNICAGNYFFAFGPTDSDTVSATRNFGVTFDSGKYSNPVITVYYLKVSGSEDQLVQKVNKQDL